MRYKKRPIIVDAFQPIKIVRKNPPMRARMNDFIIRGIHGELYACKPSIFYETYERVD